MRAVHRDASSEPLSIEVQLAPKRLAAVSAVLALLNLGVLAGTWFFSLYFRSLPGSWEEAPRVKYLYVQLNLGTENVVASWYSSMLLLLVGVGATLCFVADSARYRSRIERKLTYGWLAFAFVFMVLSLDEVASLHERIGMLAVLNPFGDYAIGWVYVLALPIVVAASLMLAFGWMRIRRNPLALSFLVLGVLLFLTVPFQEKFEFALLRLPPAETPWLKHDIHVLWEEGAELFGSLSFLAATVLYTLAAARQLDGGGSPRRPVLRFTVPVRSALTGIVVSVFLLGSTLIALPFIMPYMSEGDTGIPQNWYPAALGLLAAILLMQIRDGVPDDERSARRLYLASALYCVSLSAYYGASIYGYLYWEYAGMIGLLFEGALLLPAPILSALLAKQVSDSGSRVGTVSWAVLLVLAFAAGTTYTAVLAFAAFGYLLFSLVAHLQRWQPASPLTAPG